MIAIVIICFKGELKTRLLNVAFLIKMTIYSHLMMNLSHVVLDRMSGLVVRWLIGCHSHGL